MILQRQQVRRRSMIAAVAVHQSGKKVMTAVLWPLKAVSQSFGAGLGASRLCV